MNIIPNHLRACHLQAIIDQNPKDDTARRARELLERLPRHSGQVNYPDACEYAESVIKEAERTE